MLTETRIGKARNFVSSNALEGRAKAWEMASTAGGHR